MLLGFLGLIQSLKRHLLHQTGIELSQDFLNVGEG